MPTTRVVAVANLKGGVGKSTTTINLAAAAELAGLRTGIIDIDPEQQAAAKWSDAREKPAPIVISRVYSRLPQAIAELEKEGVQLVVIDCPAFDQKATSSAISAADLVLVPCRTTVQDVQFLSSTVNLAASAQKPAAVILNAVETQIRETDEARAFVEASGIALAPVHLSKAVAYHRAITAGLGVNEYEPSGKAAQEVHSLLEWISGLLDLSDSINVDQSTSRKCSA